MRISTDDLLEELARVAASSEGPPSFRAMDEHGAYAAMTYVRRFGSWTDALEAAGLSGCKASPAYSYEQLLDHLRAANRHYQALPTMAQLESFNEHSASDAVSPHPQTYVKRFGSWTDALEAAFPDAELEAELWQIAEETGRRPFKRDLEEHGRFDHRAYRQRFGSWRDALTAAGFDPDYEIPREFLIRDLQRIGEKLGFDARSSEIEDMLRYSYHSYSERIGDAAGLRSALAVAEREL
jgi:hypothetical protein